MKITVSSGISKANPHVDRDIKTAYPDITYFVLYGGRK
jgi:hypothetical protein